MVFLERGGLRVLANSESVAELWLEPRTFWSFIQRPTRCATTALYSLTEFLFFSPHQLLYQYVNPVSCQLLMGTLPEALHLLLPHLMSM